MSDHPCCKKKKSPRSETGDGEAEKLCPLVRDVYALFRDGALSEESERLVRSHLSACPRCAKFYRLIARTEKRARDEKPSPPAPPEEDYAALARRLRRTRRKAALLQGALTALLAAGSAAALLALASSRENCPRGKTGAVE